MASVYKRKLKHGQYWFGAVRQRDGTWKKYNTGLKVSEYSKRKAEDHVAYVQAELHAGREPLRKDSGGKDISLLAARYIEERRPYWGERTLPLHTHTLKLLQDCIGDVPIESFNREHIKKFTEHLKRRGGRNTGEWKPLSVHSLNIHLRNLRAFLRWTANETGQSTPHVSELPAPASGHRDYFSEQECRALLSAANKIVVNGQPFSGFLTCLLLTGMRKGEVLAMEWVWIDFRLRQILIPPEITKTKHKRSIPISSSLLSLLESWPRLGDRVFMLSSGSGYVDETYRKAVASAGIRYLKMHNLRDTFAVHSLLSGVPLAVVSAILGHSSVVTTIKHYGAIAGDELRIASEQTRAFAESILPARGKMIVENKGHTVRLMKQPSKASKTRRPVK